MTQVGSARRIVAGQRPHRDSEISGGRTRKKYISRTDAHTIPRRGGAIGWDPKSAITAPGVAEMKRQKPAKPGEGLPGCRQACRLSRVSRPFRTLREGTVGGLATFAEAWKHARSLGGASDVPYVQRVRARLARGVGGGGWTLHVSDGRADWAVMRREAGMMWASQGGGERLKCEAGVREWAEARPMTQAQRNRAQEPGHGTRGRTRGY